MFWYQSDFQHTRADNYFRLEKKVNETKQRLAVFIMSWLFGGYNKEQGGQIPPGLAPPQGGGGGAGDGPPGSGDKSKMEAYRFDSAALERAAEAAKTLEKSSE